MSQPKQYSPLWQLTLARVRESLREPMALFWVYAFPLVLAIVLGMAFREGPKPKVRIDFVEGQKTEQLREQFATDDFTVSVQDESEASRRLQRGVTDLVVERDADGKLTYRTEDSRTESRLAEYMFLSVVNGPPTSDMVKGEPISTTGNRYIDFLIPGLIAMNLMGGGFWGVGFVIVDQRIRGLLKRFHAAPMRRRDFLLSLMLGRIIFVGSEVIILWLVGWAIFGISMAGSWLLFVGLIFLGGAAFSGVGMLMACRAQRAESVSGLISLAMLIQFTFSGIFFSADRFPEAIQPIVQVLPLTALADAMRAVSLDGAGPLTILPDVIILAVWGVVSFTLALLWFRWR